MAHIVLVNPWIYDFAAFDLWQKPLGLLYLGGVLREQGHRVSLIDCLDRYNPALPLYLRRDSLPGDRPFGTGKYPREELAKPEILKRVPRKFSRYGLPHTQVMDLLSRLDEPDIFLVTSAMTYWYPGVIDTIAAIKRMHPGKAVLLGGIYATLCREHAAAQTGADCVISGEAENIIMDAVNEYLGAQRKRGKRYSCLDEYPYPALELYHGIRSIPLLTTRGCPLSCAFCASKAISGAYRRREPALVAKELMHWKQGFGTKDVAFFDDALLINARSHFIPLMEKIIGLREDFRFHSPNGLSPACIDASVADCMKEAGFETLRLSLETTSTHLQDDISRKVSEKGFTGAVDCLKEGRTLSTTD